MEGLSVDIWPITVNTDYEEFLAKITNPRLVSPSYPLVLGIVNLSPFHRLNQLAIHQLEEFDLRQGRDFGVMGLPPAYSEWYSVPFLRVNDEKKYNFSKNTTFGGIEDIVWFLNNLTFGTKR